MNARTFNLICVAVIIAVGAAAIAVVETSPHGSSLGIPGLEGGELPVVQPLDLTLSLVILADFGLMVTALVWVFKDDPSARPPD